MRTYEFAMPQVVHAGDNARARIPEILKSRHVERPLLITDRNLGRTSIPRQILVTLNHCEIFDQVTPDPSEQDVLAAVRAIQKTQADGLIALGGGSSIDVAKLAGLLVNNSVDLIELADDWSLAPRPALPLLAIPTTVGSGSEMTRGAVFIDSKQEVKRVVIADSMAATDVVLDPTLLSALPRPVIASTGADALTQALEGVVSTAANAFTDAVHLQAIRMIHWALPRAYRDASDTTAMGAMQEAAAMVGAGLARSGVGAAHAIANVLGGHYHIPHGVACAIMLKPVLRFNGDAVPERFREIAATLGIKGADDDREVVEKVREEIERLLTVVELTNRLRDYGVTQEHMASVAREAAAHSDMSTNPRPATEADVVQLLMESW